MAQCEADYGLELARGGSHIASMLTSATLNATVTEVADDFVRRHGTDELSIFLKGNQAQRLYERSGFRLASQGEHELHLI